MEIFCSGSCQNCDLGQEQLNNVEESAKGHGPIWLLVWCLYRFEEQQAKKEFSLTGR